MAIVDVTIMNTPAARAAYTYRNVYVSAWLNCITLGSTAPSVASMSSRSAIALAVAAAANSMATNSSPLPRNTVAKS